MKKIAFFFVLIAATYLSANAQQNTNTAAVNTKSEAYQILGNIKEGTSRTFDYNETPNFALKRQSKNFWRNLTPEQKQVLNTYGYPKYVSYGVNSLEKDIVTYEKACKQWENNNLNRTEEIRQALGIKK